MWGDLYCNYSVSLFRRPLGPTSVDQRCTVDGDLNSTSAMTPDPNTLSAVNANDCTSEALPNNQALQRKSVRNESAPLAAQATAIPPCLNTLIVSHLQNVKKKRRQLTSDIY